jgi:fatty-acyl-CoA synthase
MNIIQKIDDIAGSEPGRVFATLVYPDAETDLTYAGLMERARSAAVFLKGECGALPGDVVIIILEHSTDLLAIFIGCMIAGTVPTLIAVPNEKIDPAFYREKISDLLKVSGGRFLIAEPGVLSRLQELTHLAQSLERMISPEEISGTRSSAHWAGLDSGRIPAEKTAFLQHSSGTTGHQKGVMLSHQAVLAQIESLSDALELDPQKDVIVSWLPLYHDMGLIGSFLLPVLTGTRLVIMSPFEWVREPVMLLRASMKHRATMMFLPNFSYNFMANPARLPEDKLAGLDLSSLRALINCSEPVKKSSHMRFMDRFRNYGLKESVLCASYALAENTFAATVGGIKEKLREDRIDLHDLTANGRAVVSDKPERYKILVSSGTPVKGTQVRILDGEFSVLPDRKVGQIALKSGYMLDGYYHRPELSEQVFHEGWYLTGDIGYMTGGHLFVIGRKKDIIIVGGKNIYPEDIELSISEIRGIHPGRVAVFGVFEEEEGTERIVVVAEADGTADRGEMKKQIKKIVSWETGYSVSDILLVEEKWLLKTSSGKVSREGNRRKYLEEIKKEDLIAE